MRRLLVTMLISLLLAACAPLGTAPGGSAGQAPSQATTTPAAGQGPNATATAIPTQAAATAPTTSAPPLPAQLSTPTNTPLAKASPTPPLSATPAAGAAQPGWKTFSDPQAAFQIDYPADWTVADQGGVTEFWLAPGVPISLAQVNTGGLSPEVYLANAEIPNSHCTRQTSRSGMAYSRCFDTIARSNSAEFVAKDAQGAARLFSLSTGRGGDVAVFDSMLASLRA